MESLYKDEKSLLYHISVGNENAFRFIFEKYHKKVYCFALKIIKSPVLAEDILHDVFLKIHMHTNINSIDKLESYLMITTRNHTLKVLRKQQLATRFNNELIKTWVENHNETEETIIFNESEKILCQAIKLLPHRQQTVYKLCHQEGYKYHEAAKLLSLSPLTVKTHMQQALRFLRKYLSDNGCLTILCPIMWMSLLR